MKKEFIVERNGRSFVLYAGLLEEAHSQGLKSVRTHLIQVPSSENGHLAIVHAEVETDHGVFAGIGDASPDTVSRMVAPHFIRMAETRAKARALRDAVNVGVTALEELGDLDHDLAITEETAASERESAGLSRDDGRSERPRTSGPWVPATSAQIKAMYVIGRNELQLSEDEVDERCRRHFGRAAVELSKREASEFIDLMKQQPVNGRG